MYEFGDAALCDIAEVITGKTALRAPRILTQYGDPWGSIAIWYVPAIPAAILVEYEAGNSSGGKERRLMTALPAKDEEAAWRIAFDWVDDWQAARPVQEKVMDDSPF